MITRQDYIAKITNALALLSRNVEISASLNLTDINIHAEIFFRDLLNLSLGYNLINLNQIVPNMPSIDLGDFEKRIAIQVTSTSSLIKTRKTVTKFIEKKLYDTYDRLVIFNLVKATRHNIQFVGDADIFQLDTSADIWDYVDFSRKISNHETGSLKEISDFLAKELDITPDEKLPREVQTIVALIDHLSNCDHPESGKGYIEDPDPNGKIYKRFSEHTVYITNIYKDLYKIYGPILKDVKNITDIGTVQANKKSVYLKIYSDKILTKCNGDPQAALERLTRKFGTVIGKKGIDYDETAITFFLVEELTRCNVFPNTEVING